MTTRAETALARVSTGQPRKRFNLRWITGMGPTAAALIAGAVVWELIGQVAGFRFFPPLSDVVARLVEMTLAGEILPPLTNSLTNLAIGFGFTIVVGVGVGLLMGAYRRVETALDIYVYAMLTAPSLVFAPILFSIFGLGRAAIVGVIILYTIFIVIISTTSAVKTVPRPLIEMGRSYCANDRQLFLRVIIPAATPMIMAGLRIGAGRAVKGMINGEMFIAAVGLGELVTRAGNRFDATSVLAVLILIILVAFFVVRIVQLVDMRLTRWLPETQRRKK